MNKLEKEIREITALFARKNLDIDIYKEHYEKDGVDNPFRAYICSKSLGGTLIVNDGQGWIPIYPIKPNYPMKYTWYSPGDRVYKPTFWREALKACIDPKTYLAVDPVGQRVAEQRAEKLRNQLRGWVMLALIEAD
jgi:hypothetical protein